jgi:hypothetical protein
MLFCTPHNVSVFCFEIKLGATHGNIPKGYFAIALNRILSIPVPPLEEWAKNDLKDF